MEWDQGPGFRVSLTMTWRNLCLGLEGSMKAPIRDGALGFASLMCVEKPFRVILGLYRDNGKENGGNVGIMEKKMEAFWLAPCCRSVLVQGATCLGSVAGGQLRGLYHGTVYGMT